MYVATQADLDALIERISGSPILAIDTEFHREKSYYPKLCLVQMATDEVSAIVDPLAIDSLSPLKDILTDDKTMKVFHAGDQDIEILLRHVGVIPTPLFDTQVAAGLLGQPQQIGYGALVKAECDVSLAKSDSFTDWTRRPLSATQLEYAIDDVLYLPGIYRKMRGQLEETGRLSWLDKEFSSMADPATYVTDPQEAWRKVKRISSLTRRQLTVTRAIAAWREETAQRHDVPRKWVLTDDLIVEIARRCPRDQDSLLEVRGLSEKLSERSIKEMLDAIEQALSSDPETWPKVSHKKESERDVEGAVDLMSVLLRYRARQRGVTTQFLASRDDLVRLAAGHGEGSPLLSGWRKDIIGDELVDLLAGRLSLSCESGEIIVRGCGREPSDS